MSSLQDIKNVVLELVFVLTTENSLFHYLGLIALIIDYIQLCAFALIHPVPWNVDWLQTGLEYSILPWPVTQATFILVGGTALFTIGTILVLSYQVFVTGGVSSVSLLRIGRGLTGLSATVLFFPFVETFLEALFHTVAPFPTFVPVLLLILFFLFIAAFTFLYICPDVCSSDDPTQKISTRPEVLDIAGRFLIAIASHAFPIKAYYMIFWLVVAAILGMNLFYPYFVNNRINYIRAGMLGSLLLLASVGLSVVTDPSADATRFYIALGLMPLFGALFSYISYWRLSRLDGSRLILKDDIQGVIGRCHSATDVELATRFTFNAVSDDKRYVSAKVGMRIFEAGLKQYPDSVYLHSRYAIFMVFVVFEALQREERQAGSMESERKSILGKIRRQIERTMKRKVPIDLDYCFFYIITRLEHTATAARVGEDKLFILDSIRYRHDLTSARFHHRQALDAVHTFWKCVVTTTDASAKYWHLARLADIYDGHLAKAEFLYHRLITKFPKSMESLKSYLSFLRDADHNEPAAQEVEGLIELLIEREERRAETHNMSAVMSMVSFASHGSVSNNNNGNPEKSGEDQQQEENQVAFSLLNNTFRKGTRSTRGRGMWHHLSTALRRYMLISILIVIAGEIVLFPFSTQTFQALAVNKAQTVEETFPRTQEMAYLARQVEMLDTFGLADMPLPDINARMLALASEVAAKIDASRRDTFWFLANAEGTWAEIDIEVRTRSGPNIMTSLRDVSTLINSYVSSANTLAKRRAPTPHALATFSRNTTHAFTDVQAWTFMMDNFLFTLEHTWHISLAIGARNQEDIRKQQNTLIIFLVLVLTLPTFVALFFVAPSFIAVARERQKVFELFRAVPNDCANEIAVRHRVARAELNAVESGADNRSIKSAVSSSNLSDHDTTNSAGNSSDILLVQFSRSPVWVRLVVAYVFSLAVMFGIIGTNVATIFYAGDTVFDLDGGISYSSLRGVYPVQILAMAQELVRGDAFIHGDFDELRAAMAEELEMAFHVHQGVMYGNDSMALSGSLGRNAAQDSLIYDRLCEPGETVCSSTDELYAEFLHLSKILIAEPNDHLNFDNDIYLEIKRVVQGPLVKRLQASTQIFRDEIQPTVDNILLIQSWIFGLSFPIAILEVALIYFTAKMLEKHIDGTKKLLSMVPFETAAKHREIVSYLRRGALPRTKKVPNEKQMKKSATDDDIEKQLPVVATAIAAEKGKETDDEEADTIDDLIDAKVAERLVAKTSSMDIPAHQDRRQSVKGKISFAAETSTEDVQRSVDGRITKLTRANVEKKPSAMRPRMDSSQSAGISSAGSVRKTATMTDDSAENTDTDQV